MIIVKLTYGLANQMFQYAAAKALALRNKQPVKLDLSFFTSVDTQKLIHEKYGLSLFNGIDDKLILPTENIKKIRCRYESALLFRSLNKATKYLGLSARYEYCWEREFLKMDLAILQKKARIIYLTGYFQNEIYFADYPDEIRKDLIFRPELLDAYNLSLAENMQKKQSVSIHIRRGDYVGNRFIAPLSYYREGIAYLSNKLSDLEFYIFSDDPDWVKENMPTEDNYFFINHNMGEESYKDMYLMTQCKHNIIANSSFSWWGAWLNDNKDKIVISPKEWLPEKGIMARDIVPISWIKI